MSNFNVIYGSNSLAKKLDHRFFNVRQHSIPLKFGLVIIIAALALASVSLDSTSTTVAEAAPGDNVFVENFVWQGNHASSILGGTATTVWWDENSWDARTDTSYNGATAAHGNDHIDVHKSVADLESGVTVNDEFAVGGNGGPGVGIMHLDFETVASSRLRNPMLISDDQPGVVEFRTSNFVTTGHWWEVSITPTDIVTGAEFTAVPSTADAFDQHPGAGHRPAEDSVNYISLGSTDVPCTSGWFMKNGVTTSFNGVTEDFSGPPIPTDPSLKDVLFAWRLEFYPDKIMAFVDLDRDGIREHHNTINVNIPWNEVYVALLGVAYQANHHPGCLYQGQVREIPWKDVKVSPVKYARTASYPKNEGTVHVPQLTGWMDYDLRDTQRFGPITANPPQPNESEYSQHTDNAFCQGGVDFTCGSSVSVSSKTLSFNLPEEDADGITRAQLVYDIRRDGGGTLRLNGQNVGSLPRKSTVPAAVNQYPMWAQRSIDVDPSLFVAGENTITIDLEGHVNFDRLHFDFAYGEVDETPPSAPSGLGVTTISESQIDLGWSAANDPESGIIGYEVYRNGALIANAAGTSYSDMGLTESTSYTYHVIALNSAGLESGPSNSASATTNADVTPPSLVSASIGSQTAVHVRFSEPVEQASAANPNNYTINGINIVSASLGADLETVTLSTSPHSDGTYTLAVSNVRDRAISPNTIAGGAQLTYEFSEVFEMGNLNVASGSTYQIEQNFQNGSTVYNDRAYAYQNIPGDLAGSHHILTSNSDKSASGDPFMTFDVNQDVLVSIVFDDRLPIPAWLQDFDDSGENIEIADNTHSVLSREFNQGTVSLGANEGSGSSSMYTVIVTPSIVETEDNLPPSAIFTADPVSGDAPLTVNFDASASSDADGTILGYEWSFGDGTMGSGVFTSHTFATAGSYEVTLSVIDDDGASTLSEALSIGVDEPPPPPESMVSNLNVASGLNYLVIDGGFENGASVFIDRTFQFSDVPGSLVDSTYVMTANADKQDSSDTFMTFDVDRNVKVYVAYDDRLSMPAWLSSFDDTGLDVQVDGNDHSLLVEDFSQGQVILGANQGIPASSMYSVIVVPSNIDPPENEEPTASFSFSPGVGDAPMTVQFDASFSTDPDGSIVRYDWNFGDGSIGTGMTISHEFIDDGTYQVELTVTDDDDAADSVSAFIIVNNAFSLSIQDAEVEVNSTTEIPLILSKAPAGIAGYIITVSIDSQAVEIVDVQFPDFTVTDFQLHSFTQVQLRAGDLSGTVPDGDTNVLLATLVVRGISEGSANASISDIMLDDRNGEMIDPELVSGTINVIPASRIMPTLPGQEAPVRDLDGDGLAEDINGNERLDFADLTAFYTNYTSVEVQSNFDLFDFDGSGAVDEDDVLRLLDLIMEALSP